MKERIERKRWNGKEKWQK